MSTRIFPTPAQQHRFQTVRLELVGASEVPRWSELIETHHYLHTATLVGEVLRYAAVDEHGEWCALLGYSSASLHLKARDEWVGWTSEQRESRRHFVTQNSRFLVLPGRACPYLLILPRFIAWLASRLLDPAWWPAFYNLTSFALWLAVIARTFSPRLPLPPTLRPWLALALFPGPHSGEILFNITNLQWVVSFLLVQQAFLAAPTTTIQRVTDLALLVLLGLTGPFIIAVGPLLAWRWWRARRGALPQLSSHDFQLLIVASLCAAVQAWFILRTGPKFIFPPFVASQFFAVVGQRLVIFPVLGDDLARRLPSAVLACAGLLPVVALLLWSLRPHPRQLLRAQLAAAFILLLLAGVYRSRPDTWHLQNLVFSDRYFYLPRVLLAWLLILEIDTPQRAVAWTARALLLACALIHLKDYTLPPGPDYHWTQHVDPIRRGVPANLPTLPEGWTLEYRGRPAPK